MKSIKERETEKAEERTGEDRQERTARELIELLNELRVILPGVQVLFAFLLTVPFTQRFPDLDDLETRVFFMTLLCTAVATALLIAPSAHHRILWRRGVREQRLVLGNRLTIAGLIFLLPAIVGVVFVITAFIFDLTAAIIVTGLLALFFALLWFALPLRYREAERLNPYCVEPSLGSVTAPSEADETRAAYLAITPVANRGSGSCHPVSRACSSSEGRSTLKVLFSMSKVTVSPSFRAAMGPRWAASGATWPAIRPRVAPEKRPSVRRATVSPRPWPTRAAVTPSISRMPGPPFGPS